MAEKHSTQGPNVGLALRIGLAHTSDCDCAQCARRKQLLSWRDSVLQAQRHVDTERRRFLASHGSLGRLQLPVQPRKKSILND